MLKECLWCRIYCARLGTCWHSTVTTSCAVSIGNPGTLPLGLKIFTNSMDRKRIVSSSARSIRMRSWGNSKLSGVVVIINKNKNRAGTDEKTPAQVCTVALVSLTNMTCTAWNKHVHLKEQPKNIWQLSLMWWSWIMQSVSTWLVEPNTKGVWPCDIWRVQRIWESNHTVRLVGVDRSCEYFIT